MLSCPQCSVSLARVEEGYLCGSCKRTYPIVEGIPSFVGEGGDRGAFDPRFFAFLEDAEAHHFWFIGRREIILDTLKRQVPDLPGKRMLEIGCANGSTLRYLEEETELQLTGSDLFIEALRVCRTRTDVPLYQVDATKLPFREQFDIVSMFDVLEHIEDDGRVLQECRKALKERGWLVLTVPASPALWSSFDELSHHRRRYTSRGLRERLEEAGFAVERAAHFMFFLFPLVRVVRWLSRRPAPSVAGASVEPPTDLRTIPVLNGLLLRLLRLEKLLLRYMSPPFGTSLLVVARKV